MSPVASIERAPAREQLRLVLGPVVDELADAACRRVLGSLYAAARREHERLHAHDGQLEFDAA